MENNNLIIRKAEKKDIPRIGELLGQVNRIHHDIRPDLFKIGRKYSESDLEEIINDPERPVFCAIDAESGALVGYCMTELTKTDDAIRTKMKTIYIDDLCVDEKCRGKHTGSALYEAVADFGRQNGFYNITLHVWEGNDKAKAFYEAMGMKTMYTCLEEIL